jgi:hypothetical protein
MLRRNGTVRILLALLSDGSTGHERQFCDTKTGGRILSSEKGKHYPEIPTAAERFWSICAALATLQRATAEPTLCELQGLTPLGKTAL